jgi:hypothetical protein
MKKFLPLSFILMLTVFIFAVHSCSNKDTGIVCTQNLPATASAGAAILFSGCGSALGTYTWTFGDGSKATGDSVIHAYATTGTYSGSVNLTNLSNNVTKNFTVKIVNNGWTFGGVNFGSDSVVASPTGGTLSAIGSSGTEAASLVFVFHTLPTVSGAAYTVISAASGEAGPGQMFVTLYTDSANVRHIYGSTGSGAVSVQVSVSDGKISLSLPSIELVNQNLASDSATLTAAITQTQ